MKLSLRPLLQSKEQFKNWACRYSLFNFGLVFQFGQPRVKITCSQISVHFNNSIEGSFREDDYTYDNDGDLVYQPQQNQVQQESLMRNDEIGSITTTNTALLTTDPMPPTYSSSLGQELLMNCRTTSECKDLFDKIILKQMVRNDRQQKNTA